MRFAVVGVLGFVIDAGLTATLSLALPAYVARAPAFLLASFVTYVLNRTWTFAAAHGPLWRTYVAYLFATAFGAAVNYAVFAAVVALWGSDSLTILEGVALGSIAGLAFNFSAASMFVFRSRSG